MTITKNKPHDYTDITWDYTVDALVIGSGFAGLSAAIEANENKLDVLVIEKMNSFGGNSIISDGGIAAPNTHLQKQFDISDSEQLMYDDILAAGLGLNQPDLVKTVVTSANHAFQWTIDTLGVPYLNRVDLFGGHSVPRCYTPEGVTGATIVLKMIEQIKIRNISIQYRVAFLSFICDQQGRVIGAYVLEDYDYKTNSGSLKTIKANRGIVLATGGFGADVSFRALQDPRLTSDIQTTNKPFATAEALKSALTIGAASVQLSHIQLGAWSSPDEKGFGAGPLFADYILFQYGVIIDPKTGKRFVNELGDRKKTADAILNIGHSCIGIADHIAVEQSGWDISKAIKKDVVRTFDSLDEIADFYQIDTTELNKTIATYNLAVEAKHDAEFNKPIVSSASPISTAPYYVMRLWPKVHYTMGGVAINTKSEVLDFDGNIIEGLYAAGEVVGGVHGASRLGSCAITDCIVFGRIAGKQLTHIK